MNVFKLSNKFPDVPRDQISQFISDFQAIDINSSGSIEKASVIASLQETEKGATYDSVRETLKEVRVDSSGRLEIEDYIELVTKLREGRNTNAGSVTKGKLTVKGSNANTTHSINEDERTEFTRHINSGLAGDPDIGSRLPIPTHTFQLFDECKDGLILSKLINDSVPDTIDERVLNKATARRPLNAFQMTENNNIVISSSKGIGCSVVNIGAQDLVEGREHLILGLIWQIIRKGLLSKIDIKIHPELYRLLEDGETLEKFLRLPPDQILLRWFNYHLAAAKWNRRVTNFSGDVSDAENYTVLLNQLMPEECSRSPLQTRDVHTRAEQTLENADRIGCRKFLTANSLVAGNPKLNLAFVANLFNTHPGLAALEKHEAPAEIEDFDAEGEREARVFTLWLNSMDVDPGVHDLFEDLKDGTILLQAFDKIIPNSVTWRRVTRRDPDPERSINRFKRVENTNYVTEIATNNHIVLVGTQGSDIVDGSKTLVLGLVWQIMRLSIGKTLATLGRNGKEITDMELVTWANGVVKKGGKSSTMKNFQDRSLKTGIFLLDMLNGLKPGYVDYDLVTDGRTEESAKQNAKLAISIARKLNVLIFLVPEDIVEVRSKLIFTFVGATAAAHI